MTLPDLIRISSDLNASYSALVAELERAPAGDLDGNADALSKAFLILSSLSDCAVCEAAYRAKGRIVQ